jgi:hypothetical protein
MKVRKSIDRRTGTLRLIAAGAVALALSLAVLVPSAGAETPQPHWTITSFPVPTHFQAGDEGDFFEVIAVNDGTAPTDGSSYTITDNLPSEVTATSVSAGYPGGLQGLFGFFMECPTNVTCETSSVLPVGEYVTFKVQVSVGPNPPAQLFNSVTISGGGAEPATVTRAATVSSEPVSFGASLTARATELGAGGNATRAGSHPTSLTTMIDLNVGIAKARNCATIPGLESPGCSVLTADARDLGVVQPPGLIGNPTAVPQCPQRVFQEDANHPCPRDAIVGFVSLLGLGSIAYVYNIEPPVGQPAELGFTVAGLYKVPIFFHLRSDGDYGLTAQLTDITEANPIRASLLTIWGVPGDPIHNPLRGEGGGPGVEHPQPFLTMPTSCADASLPIPLTGDSWQNSVSPLPLLSAPSLSGMTGCNQLDFNPSVEARPTTNRADSPSGLHVDIHVPQNNEGPEGGEDPNGLATAHLKDAVIALPKGLTVNPSSAAGLEGCTPAQIGLRSPEGATPIRTTADPAACPDASKLGTVEVDTQLIDHPLPGSVYLATPFDNPFKTLLAIYITVNDPKTNVVVKLAGKVSIAPDGQLTTTVSENPQVPFEDFKLDFFGGARAPLRTPAVCGNYETTAELTPWSAPESGPPASKSDAYQISSGPNGHACANTEAVEPNSPSFEAGAASPLAGAYSPFSLHLHREDGSQVFSALNVTLPPGLVGKLAGVGECPDSALATAAGKTGAQEQASPSCPASSRIGSVNVAAGAGPSPFNAGGVAYLSGPYKGAPLSVAVITPAVAGPFDLGTVVVRNALQIDPETAQVSVRSDPIPTQLQGIQLDIRSIDVNLDRQQFTLNPTNCERFAVSGEEVSSLGNSASLTSPFQVGECAKLGFKPKLALKLSGKTKRTGHPALRAQLTYPKGNYANIARAQVTLPHSEFLDQAHIGTVCTRVQFKEGKVPGEKCPAASIYGRAEATTPLLDEPLKGAVYLRSSSHKLPDLVAALHNNQVDFALDGRIDSVKNGRIRNTFETVPDAPVSKFVLEMQGGKKGLLVNSTNLCKSKNRAISEFTGQNGKTYNTNPVLKAQCPKKARKGKKTRGAKH